MLPRFIKDNVVLLSVVAAILFILFVVKITNKKDYEIGTSWQFSNPGYRYRGWGENKGKMCKNPDNTDCQKKEWYPYDGWGKNVGLKCKNPNNTECKFITEPRRPLFYVTGDDINRV